MRKGIAFAGILGCTAALAAEPGVRLAESRWAAVEPQAATALARPEGTTRWELGPLVPAARWSEAIEVGPEGEGLALFERPLEAAAPRSAAGVYVDPAGGSAARDWLMPQRDPALVEAGVARALVLDRWRGSSVDHLWIRVERVGLGWIHLPSGPREVVLQKALVLEQAADGSGFSPAEIVYRFVDPRAGVVAASWGVPAADGASMSELSGVAFVEEVPLGQDPFVIHADELDPPFSRLTYGFDRGTNTAVSSLAPQAPANMGALVALGAWNLSGNNLTAYPTMKENASTTTTVSAAETCNFDECGFTIPGLKLGREDKNFTTPASADITLNGLQREDRPTDVTFWMRAAVRHEGQSGIGVDAESRICYVSEPGETRTPVPLFRFSHPDAQGYFMQLGDTWSSDRNPATVPIEPFACEQNIYFQGLAPCSCGLFCKQRIAPCQDSSCGGGTVTFDGTQASTVVATGPLTLPSGHTFFTTVIKQVAEFCTFSNTSSCPLTGATQPVRTVLWLWEAPWLGTLVRLQSVPLACQEEGLTTLAETDIKFGLFPPRTITVGNVTDTTVALSWDPGLDTHRIGVPGSASYRIYWDTDSGANSPYAFNSIDQAGQVAINGTTATIGGLTPGMTYYFSVTSRSKYTNPASGVATVYESLLYPTQVAGPGSVVPVEVQATPGACAPTQEVHGVTIGKTGSGIEICWQPVADPCINGYRILGAETPEAEGNFVPVADVGLVTCHPFDPDETYFLVAGRGAGGIGPTGYSGP